MLEPAGDRVIRSLLQGRVSQFFWMPDDTQSESAPPTIGEPGHVPLQFTGPGAVTPRMINDWGWVSCRGYPANTPAS